MARKLMKHEILNSWLEITIVCGAIIGFSLIFKLLLSWRVNSSELLLFTVTALALLYIVAGVLMIINIVRSFNKKIFSDEGYLTLTLPVSVDELIISKVVVNLLWIALTIITFVISASILGSSFLGVDSFHIIAQVGSYISDYPLMFILNLIGALIQILAMILILIFVLSVLNIGIVKKYKLLIGVIIYYLISLGISYIENILKFIPYVLAYENNSYQLIPYDEVSDITMVLMFGKIFDFNQLIYNIIIIIVFYLLSRNNIKSKIELE